MEKFIKTIESNTSLEGILGFVSRCKQYILSRLNYRSFHAEQQSILDDFIARESSYHELHQRLREVLDGLVKISLKNKSGEILSVGSGFLISDDGYFVTNHHVIRGLLEDGNTGTISFIDGSSYPIILSSIQYKIAGDLAIFQVKGPSEYDSKPCIQISDVKVGDKVIAIGFLGGKNLHLSSGVIDYLFIHSSEAGDADGGIFTTAQAGRGCSGGVFINGITGELVGIINEATGIGPEVFDLGSASGFSAVNISTLLV